MAPAKILPVNGLPLLEWQTIHPSFLSTGARVAPERIGRRWNRSVHLAENALEMGESHIPLQNPYVPTTPV